MQVDGNTARKIEKITSSANNSNGCRIPATWFTLVAGSSCSVVQERYRKGDEFACHTMTHKELTSSTSKSTMTKEIVGSRNWLVKKCGLPENAVTGFRSPFLTTNKRVRQVRKWTNSPLSFLSSISEQTLAENYHDYDHYLYLYRPLPFYSSQTTSPHLVLSNRYLIQMDFCTTRPTRLTIMR